MFRGKIVRLRYPYFYEHPQLVQWRNDARRFFFTDVTVSLFDHLRWYWHIRRDPTQRFFVIESLNMAKPIGTIGLVDIDVRHGHAEYGRFTIDEALRGNGYGTDALSVLLDYAFLTLYLNRVYGDIFAWNSAAIRLDEKIGFRHEGTFTQHIYTGGIYHNVVRMAILAKDWRRYRR